MDNRMKMFPAKREIPSKQSLIEKLEKLSELIENVDLNDRGDCEETIANMYNTHNEIRGKSLGELQQLCNEMRTDVEARLEANQLVNKDFIPRELKAVIIKFTNVMKVIEQELDRRDKIDTSHTQAPKNAIEPDREHRSPSPTR